MNENGVEKNLKCSKCGIILLPTDKYCGNCGNPVSLNDKVNDTLKCSRCGSPLHSTDRYCNNCGNPTALKGIAPEKLIFVNPKYFDPIFENGEEVLLEEVIKREISKLKIDINTKLLPLDILKRNTRRFAKRQLTWFRRDSRINKIQLNLN